MILVTGSTGLVGSHLIFQLLKNNKKVRALKRGASDISQVKKVFSYYTSQVDEHFNKIEWFDSDITDKAGIFDAMEGIEEVFHTAAWVSFAPKDKIDVLEFNINGTANIVDAALDKLVKKLCFVSSTAALGAPNEEFEVDELSPWMTSKDRSVYSVSKFKSEMEVWRGINEGLNAVIVNPSIIIGPGNWERSSCKMFKEIWNGMKFYTHGITGYVDVNDVVNIMIGLMEKKVFGEKFIVSEGNYSYKEMFGKIADGLGKKRPSIHATTLMAKMAFTADYFVSSLTGKTPVITKETISASKSRIYFSNEKIVNQLGYKFKSIDKSVKETAGCFLNDSGVKRR